jgi:hypothetical protein
LPDGSYKCPAGTDVATIARRFGQFTNAFLALTNAQMKTANSGTLRKFPHPEVSNTRSASLQTLIRPATSVFDLIVNDLDRSYAHLELPEFLHTKVDNHSFQSASFPSLFVS